MLENLRTAYRVARVWVRKITGTEPSIPVTCTIPLEFHGNDYCGWSIPRDFLTGTSIIVDVGVGEDISFTQSLVAKYGCRAEGFDPTPRAAEFIDALEPDNFRLHRVGLSDRTGKATFHLPTNEQYVSGSIISAEHLAGKSIEVDLVDLTELFTIIGGAEIDILKIDIEGSEYAVLESEAFAKHAGQIRALCIEFHHRWPEFGPDLTRRAVARLRALGFQCAWRANATNEEFLFVRNPL